MEHSKIHDLQVVIKAYKHFLEKDLPNPKNWSQVSRPGWTPSWLWAPSTPWGNALRAKTRTALASAHSER